MAGQVNLRYQTEDGILYDREGSVLLVCPAGRAGSFAVPPRVREIAEAAFLHCTRLEQVELPDGIARLGRESFAECTGLKALALPDGIARIGEACFRQSGLESVIWPGGTATMERETFSICVNLSNISLQEGLETVRECAFLDCPLLASATLPSSLESIDPRAFDGCTAMTALETAPGEGAYVADDGVLFTRDRAVLVVYPRGRTGGYRVPDGVRAIGERAFFGAALSEVEVPGTKSALPLSRIASVWTAWNSPKDCCGSGWTPSGDVPV